MLMQSPKSVLHSENVCCIELSNWIQFYHFVFMTCHCSYHLTSKIFIQKKNAEWVDVWQKSVCNWIKSTHVEYWTSLNGIPISISNSNQDLHYVFVRNNFGIHSTPTQRRMQWEGRILGRLSGFHDEEIWIDVLSLIIEKKTYFDRPAVCFLM